jgi:hypothetical protein
MVEEEGVMVGHHQISMELTGVPREEEVAVLSQMERKKLVVRALLV